MVRSAENDILMNVGESFGNYLCPKKFFDVDVSGYRTQGPPLEMRGTRPWGRARDVEKVRVAGTASPGKGCLSEPNRTEPSDAHGAVLLLSIFKEFQILS